MILFCDTSALVKLYLKEEHSETLLDLSRSASTLSVCRVSWAEMMAALARRLRESPMDVVAVETTRQRLKSDWPSYAIVEITQPLVELAGEYADTFALRGYDSIQLAAARIVQEATDEELRFACFDTRLQRAAKVLDMRVELAR